MIFNASTHSYITYLYNFSVLKRTPIKPAARKKKSFYLSNFEQRVFAPLQARMMLGLTHFCPLFQHMLSERLTSLGIMGETRVLPLNPSPTIVL